MTREYIADKRTLDIVNANVGASDNAASATPKTLFEGLKHLLANWTADRAAKIDSINTNAARLTATRAGYIDKLNSGVAIASLAGKQIKSVQRGIANPPSGNSYSATGNITIKAVDLAKSIVICSGGETAWARLTSATNIEYCTYSTSYKMAWQVVEFY